MLLKTSSPKPWPETIDSNGIHSKQAERLKATLHRPVEFNCNGENDHVVIIFPMQKYQKITMNKKKLSKLHSVYMKCSKKLVGWISDFGRKQEIKLSNLCRYVSRTSRGYNKLSPQAMFQMKVLPTATGGKKGEEDDFMLVLEKINEVIGSMGKVPKKNMEIS